MGNSDKPHIKGKRHRNQYPRSVEWILFKGNRLAVSGVLLTGLFLFIVSITAIGVPAVRDKNPLQLLFSAFIGGNLTLITIILSINQLVLSRQLETPGEVRNQTKKTAEFRRDAATATERRVMPALPPDFMSELVQGVQQQLQTLEEHRMPHLSEQSEGDLDDLLTTLENELDQISALLNQSDTQPFHVLTATLNADMGLWIQATRRFQALHHEELSEEFRETLDEFVSGLELIDVSREYFKTLFMQHELSYLSRVLLYVGIPAELVATGMLIVFSASSDPISFPLLAPAVVPVAVTINFAPLAVLFSFILRITIVTERTVAIVPFTTPDQVP